MKLKVNMLSAFLVICMFFSSPAAAQEAPTVCVRLDGQEIANGQISDGRTFVPIRVLTESMGYTVDWDGNTQTVELKKGAITYTMTIGSCRALRIENDLVQECYMDVAPFLKDGRTYAPLRFVAENFGCGVLWDGVTQTVYIASAMSMDLYGIQLSFGTTDLDEVDERIGGLYDIVEGADGVQRNIYIQHDTKYITVIGILDGQLFEFFTNDPTLKVGDLYVTELPGGKYTEAAYVFTDTFEDDRVVGFYACVAGARYKPYKLNTDKGTVMAQESKLAFYLTNALRVQAGSKSLKYNTDLAKVDTEHVASMAEHDFFSHEGLGGDGITDRIKAAGIYTKYTKLGEILAKMPNAYYACYGWLNSASHRAAMLDNSYTYSGIAVDGLPSENLYYAQVLVRL